MACAQVKALNNSNGRTVAHTFFVVLYPLSHYMPVNLACPHCREVTISEVNNAVGPEMESLQQRALD